MRTIHSRSFIPIEPEPTESFQNWFERGFNIALLVGIVDPQDELAAVFTSEQPVEQSGANSTDVKIARGAGSEASANGHVIRVPEGAATA